jgi:hypothetical protein
MNGAYNDKNGDHDSNTFYPIDGWVARFSGGAEILE